VRSDRAIVDAIKVARTLLSQNLPPAYNLPDAATVTRVRELVIGAQQRHASRICVASGGARGCWSIADESTRT